MSEVHFVVDGVRFPVLRETLSMHSPFLCDHSLPDDSLYDIQSRVTPELFRRFLPAITSGSLLDITPTNVSGFLELAREFGLSDLTAACERFDCDPTAGLFYAIQTRFENEQLYRRGREFLFGDGDIPRSISLGLSLLKQAAERGHADASLALGRFLEKNNGYETGIRSCQYLKSSADLGNSEAQWRYAICLKQGKGVPGDNSAAIDYLRLAAKQQNADGQVELGKCFENGEGVAQDDEEAVKYYKLSADQGNSEAQWRYGFCLAKGNGIEKDVTAAANYYKLSADQGNSEGRRRSGFAWNFLQTIINPFFVQQPARNPHSLLGGGSFNF
jgi:TPR repeat protein